MNVFGKIIKAKNNLYQLYKNGGGSLVLWQVLRKLKKGQNSFLKYQKWIKKEEKNILSTKRLEIQPSISIVLFLDGWCQENLVKCVESIKTQKYSNWQLYLVGRRSAVSKRKKELDIFLEKDQINLLDIERATLLEKIEGEYFVLLKYEGILAPNALYEIAKSVNEDEEVDSLYADEDQIDLSTGKRCSPCFRADWSPDTLMSFMYTGQFNVYRKKTVARVGEWDIMEGGADEYDLLLRMSERGACIKHIAKVLFHVVKGEKREHNPELELQNQKKVKEQAIQRRKLNADLEFLEDVQQYRVNYHMVKKVRISIIIPSKNNFHVFRRCIDSVISKSTYSNYGIIVVDNGSFGEQKYEYEKCCRENGIRYCYKEEGFNFSKMCNRGARMAEGELLLFLNDDTEVLVPDWLERMGGHAMLPHTGAVGAKLYYPDGVTLQHCGVANLKIDLTHILIGMDDRKVLRDARNRLDYNYSAVTGACLMVEQEKYWQVGGFAEELPVAYNDVDLCLNLLEQGYYNVVRNDVRLIHHESLSRGRDIVNTKKTKRIVQEREKLFQRHEEYRTYDGFFSRNYYLDGSVF